MNKQINRIVLDLTEKNNGHYYHGIEAYTPEQLVDFVNTTIKKFKKLGYSSEDIIEYFDTIEVCCLTTNKFNEEEIHMINPADEAEYCLKELGA